MRMGNEVKKLAWIGIGVVVVLAMLCVAGVAIVLIAFLC